MTIEKLARFIVDDYYNGTPGDERYLVHVDREIKRIREQLANQFAFQVDENCFMATVFVEVENANAVSANYTATRQRDIQNSEGDNDATKKREVQSSNIEEHQH